MSSSKAHTYTESEAATASGGERQPAGVVSSLPGSQSAAAGFFPSPAELGHVLAQAGGMGIVSNPSVIANWLSNGSDGRSAFARLSAQTAAWCWSMARLLDRPAREQALWTVAGMLHMAVEGREPAAGHAPAVLGSCAACGELTELLAQAAAWYDGSRPGYARSGEAIPLGARVLAVAGRFCSLIAEGADQPHGLHVLNQEAGNRLDPRLVEQFACFVEALPHGFVDSVPDHVEFEPELLASAERTGEGLVRTALELFAPALDQFSDALCVVDRDLKVLFWNRVAESLTGLAPAQVVGQVWHGHSRPEASVADQPGSQRRSLMAECLATGKPASERGYARRQDGRLVPIESHAVPILYDGQVVGAAGLFRDLSRELSLRSENESLRRLSLTDPLTKVCNRAGFDQEIRNYIASYKRTGHKCSLIMADIDHFKRINDTYGHQVGDSILRGFASLLKDCCRPDDVVARYGGEEFAIILPKCDLKTAEQRAEKIRQRLAALLWPQVPDQQVTASFGVAEVETDDTEASFVGRADEALYRSKQNGRNRTELAAPPAQVAQAAAQARSRPEYSCTWMVTPQAAIIAMKIRAFLAEHHGSILELTDSRARVHLGRAGLLARLGLASSPPLELDMHLSRTHISSETYLRVTVRPLYARTPRHRFECHCHAVLSNLRSYLMAEVADG